MGFFTKEKADERKRQRELGYSKRRPTPSEIYGERVSPTGTAIKIR